MDRHPLLDRAALTPTLTVRLGEKKTAQSGAEYPTETDHFVLKEEDGATPEILDAYGRSPKFLWIMLPYEAPVPGDPRPDDDLSVSLYNMAWGFSTGLICKGTGQDRRHPGWAESSNAGFAGRIAEIVGARVEETADGRFRIPCWGTDCPKYRLTETVDGDNGKTREKMLPGHDPDASCKLQVRFEAMLLDPAVANNTQDAPKVLAVMKLASSSINSIRGLIDGFSLMRVMTQLPPYWPQGRTQMIPVRVVRKHTRTTRGRARMHFTLAIEPTPEVWSRWLRVPPSRMFLSPAQLDEIRNVLAAEITYSEGFDDIAPRPLELAEHSPLREEAERRPRVPQGADVDDAVAAAERPEPPEEVGPDPDQEPASKVMVRALKDLLGGRVDPEDPDSQAKPETNAAIHQWLDQWHETFGVPKPERYLYKAITVGQIRWITEHVAPEPEEEVVSGPAEPSDRPSDNVTPSDTPRRVAEDVLGLPHQEDVTPPGRAGGGAGQPELFDKGDGGNVE